MQMVKQIFIVQTFSAYIKFVSMIELCLPILLDI